MLNLIIYSAVLSSALCFISAAYLTKKKGETKHERKFN